MLTATMRSEGVGRLTCVVVVGGGCDGWLRGQTFSGEWVVVACLISFTPGDDVRDWIGVLQACGIGWCVVVFCWYGMPWYGRCCNCPDGLGFLWTA